MGTYYIPPTMTVSGTPGSSFGQAANLASNFNKTNQAAANAFNVANQPQVSGNAQTYANALNYGSNYPSLNAATGQYQTGTQPPTDYNQHLRGLRAGQDLDPNISSRYPWPNIDRSGFPNTVAGEYAYQQAKAEAQNYAALGQTLGIYEDRGARQMGELEKGAAAARAGWSTTSETLDARMRRMPLLLDLVAGWEKGTESLGARQAPQRPQATSPTIRDGLPGWLNNHNPGGPGNSLA